jgi:hypothetical protein
MSRETFDVIAVIALRKSIFYKRSKDILLKQLPPQINEKEARAAVRHAISGLDNSLFIGKDEGETKRIDPSTPIEKLDLDEGKIVDEVLRRLGSRG